MSKPDSIMIDEVKYVRADALPTHEGLSYKIVRTLSAGVFAGYVTARVGQEVTMIEARRLWYWSGAASLSQLATEGVKNPKECKFAMPVSVELLQVIEILDVTAASFSSLKQVPIWKV